MKLRDLEPEFIGYREDGRNVFLPNVKAIDDAKGIMFLCPKCFSENGGPIGTHRVICWSRTRGVPDHARPGPGRWNFDGTSFEDLTLVADPPGGARSVSLNGGCKWHGNIDAGEVSSV